jgi:hypothetical protein
MYAKKEGFTVIEVNTSQCRSGAYVKKLVAEAAHSQNFNTGGIFKSQEIPSGKAAMNLLFFDEVMNS